MSNKLKALKEIAENDLKCNTKNCDYGPEYCKYHYCDDVNTKYLDTFEAQTILTLLEVIDEQREALEKIIKSFEVDYYDAKAVLADLEDEHKIAKETLKTTAEKIEGLNE